MIEVGIETLRVNLSDYLERVRRGERFVVIEDGQAVAILSSAEGTGLEARAWELVRTGAARWSGGKPAGSRKKPRIRGQRAAEIVLEDRR